MYSVKTSPVSEFQVHPQVMETYQKKDLDPMKYSWVFFDGQQTPIVVKITDGIKYVIDGVSRLNVAKELKVDDLQYFEKDVPEEEIIQTRNLLNLKIKRTFIEMCLEAKKIREQLGSSQGKKRDFGKFEGVIDMSKFEKIRGNKNELTSVIMGLDISGSTLNNALFVFDRDYNPNGKSKMGLIELIDSGEVSINNAVEKIKRLDEKKSESQKGKRPTIDVVRSCLAGGVPYHLYNKSSLKMDDVPDNSVDLSADSMCYWNQREYRNQDMFLLDQKNEYEFGQEPTFEKYIENVVKFKTEQLKKLKPGGFSITIIGESYKGGYQGVCSRVETELKKIGYILVDNNTWEKTNQKYAPHELRFRNVKESIIVARKPGGDPYFVPVTRQGSVKKPTTKKTSSGGYYMASDETCITNVIRTKVFDPQIFKEIDPKFKHDAPCPPEIYEPFILAYSKPGDTILESFIGSGNVVIALELGRKVIGYDIDPESIEFCRKRFDMALSKIYAEESIAMAA